MRRPLVSSLAAAALLLGACTNDGGEDAAPSETPTSSPTATSSPTDEELLDPTVPTESPTASETATSTPTPTETETAAATEEPTPSETASPTPTPTPTRTAEPLGSWSRSTATRGPGSALTTTDPVRRTIDNDADCKVTFPAEVTVHACASVYVRSKERHLTVVDQTDADGRAVLVFHVEGNRPTSVLRADGEARAIVGSEWPAHDGVVYVNHATAGQFVVEWSGDTPTVAADLGFELGGQEVRLDAGRIVVEVGELGGGSTEVLVPGANGSTGTVVTWDFDDPAPTTVGLRVYRAWVTGDFGAMDGLATDDVIAELRRVQNQDLFTLDGTSCELEATAATCTFRSSVGNSVWDLERRDGSVKVVKLN